MIPNCDPGSSPPFAALKGAFSALQRSIGLHVSEVACPRSPRVLLCGDLGDGQAPCISVAAGAHGDEPAGPWAVVSVLESGLLDARSSYRIWPCTNPSGYLAGTRQNADGFDVNRSFSDAGSTPESRAIIEANRDRHFVLSIDVHEDHEAEGFYCYVAGPRADELGAAVTQAVVEAGFPLQNLVGFDFDEPGEANVTRRRMEGCIIMDDDERGYFDGLSLNLRMAHGAAGNVVTLEAPRRRPWDDRIAIHRIAIVSAIHYFATALSRTNGTV
jgi:murein peptide amidase A